IYDFADKTFNYGNKAYKVGEILTSKSSVTDKKHVWMAVAAGKTLVEQANNLSAASVPNDAETAKKLTQIGAQLRKIDRYIESKGLGQKFTEEAKKEFGVKSLDWSITLQY